MNFSVDTSVSELGISFCVIKVSGLNVKKTNNPVQRKRKEIISQVKKRIEQSDLTNNPFLLGYREIYQRLGAGNRILVSSCETLLNMIRKNGSLPTINTVVDLYNCISALRLVTIGAHDADKIEGDLRVITTFGSEKFLPLGADKEEKLPPGEFAYNDDKEVLCRMDIRQCDKSKVTLDTKEVIVFANSNPRMPDEVLLKACEHVCELMKTILDADAKIIAFS